MPVVQIVPMKMEHVEEALVVVEKAFGKTREECDKEWGVEAPSGAFRMFADDSPASEEEKKALSEVNAALPGSSKYFVSLKDGKVTGVSGTYSAAAGYAEQIGAKNPEAVRELESSNTYWLGWLAVDPNHQRQGIGEALIKRSVEDAIARAKKDKVSVKDVHSPLKLMRQLYLDTPNMGARHDPL